MKIAYYSDNFYPELSGITDTILITGKELVRRGHEVVYVAPGYGKKNYAAAKRETPADPDNETIDGMPVVRLPSIPFSYSPTGNSRISFPFGSSLPAMREWQPDVIHTQSPWGAGLEAVRVARRLRVPLVGTNHTAVEDFFPLPFVTRRWDAHYYNKCKLITAPYAQLIARMREVGFKRPGQALPNPALTTHFTPATPGEKHALRQKLGLMPPVVLYSGRLGPEKRVDVVMQAVAQLTRSFSTLTLIVTGHGSAESSLKKLATQLGIEKNVRFVGFVEMGQLVEYYRASDVFAFMSTSDSQSLSLMQAYASGIPAVCARARGLPDYTPSEVGFLIEPGKSALAASKLEALLRDDALRARMGASAVEFVKQFAPEKIAVQWEKLYQSAAAILPSYH